MQPDNPEPKTVEEILQQYNLLRQDTTQLGFTQISHRYNGSRLILRISHSGNMGNTIDSVNENLKLLTSLDDTLFMLDSLPVLESHEDGSPDYYWCKVWHYNIKPESPTIQGWR